MSRGDAATPTAGVLLMTFGSAVTSADVPLYLRSVRGGREPTAAVTAEFVRRFDVIGRSPLLDVTAAQARALEALLTARHGPGSARVEAGMLHSEPRIAAAITGLVDDGVRRIIAIVLAPQFSPLILTGYRRALDEAITTVACGIPLQMVGSWHLEPAWVASLAERVGEGLARLSDRRDRLAVVFTAHSLPRPVVERDPGYMQQIHQTIAAVAAAAALPEGSWTFAFQSAGHTPEEWLTPDLVDVLPGLRAGGASELLVVPVQFVADHLEVLYDLDVAAAEQARAAGMELHRVQMPNTSPRFISALADIVDRELASVAV